MLDPGNNRDGLKMILSGMLSETWRLFSSAHSPADRILPMTDVTTLAREAAVGDLVFIRVPALPFRKVAAVTGSWTNHVGIVVESGGADPVVAESKFPFSRLTSFSAFVGRSEGGQVALTRLRTPLTADQRRRLCAAAKRRLGVFYDTGFDLYSSRQFCSRFVREVLHEATGTELGEVITFSSLLEACPEGDLPFWRFWFFGRIPWSRQTVSPVSLLESPEVATVFHGRARRNA
jgi:hypothetical protein